MVLDFEAVKSATFGAEYVKEQDGKIAFYRMNQAQSDVFPQGSVMQQRTYSTAGIKLAFHTDSEHLRFDYTILTANLRNYFNVDVLVDNVLIFHTPEREEDDIFETVSISLPKGEKKVEIYLPYSKIAMLSDIILDDGASFHPALHQRRILCYGDSITHGLDAQHPSMTYANQLGRAFDAEVRNKAVSGDTFQPGIAENETEEDIDFVTVAYGTNDWSMNEPEDDKRRIFAFMSAVTKRFEKVFYIAPIWRKDLNKETKFTFDTSHYIEFAREVMQAFPSVHIINPWNFVSHDETFFGDARLHPNTLGHTFYANGLIETIRKEL